MFFKLSESNGSSELFWFIVLQIFAPLCPHRYRNEALTSKIFKGLVNADKNAIEKTGCVLCTSSRFAGNVMLNAVNDKKMMMSRFN
jgi:hypothetical protein